MKKNLKTYSFLHFSVLCCLLVCIYYTAQLTTWQTSLSAPVRLDQNHYSIASPNLFFPSAKSENIVYAGNNISPSSEKNTLNEFSLYRREVEILFYCHFLRHINFSRKFVLPFKTTDIIYPFNYFW
jgi:hypothetical protein